MAKMRPKPPVWPSPPRSLLPLWSLLGSLGSSAQDPALGLSPLSSGPFPMFFPIPGPANMTMALKG